MFKLRGWRVIAVACALGLYVVSVSGSAYELTTPLGMAHHVLLRKIYAVGAFTLLGFLFERSELRRARGVIAAGVALTLYSYLIELGQIAIDHANETFAQHTFDVVSGTVGGALGAFIALVLRAPSEPARRAEAVAVALAFAVLVWGYTVTYAPIDVVRALH